MVLVRQSSGAVDSRTKARTREQTDERRGEEEKEPRRRLGSGVDQALGDETGFAEFSTTRSSSISPLASLCTRERQGPIEKDYQISQNDELDIFNYRGRGKREMTDPGEGGRRGGGEEAAPCAGWWRFV